MANNNDDKKDPKSGESTRGEKIGDALRKIVSSGSASEISKEIISTVLGQAVKAKEDITLRVSNEMIALVQKIDFIKEFSKFAENHKFKVTAEIEILKKENPPK